MRLSESIIGEDYKVCSVGGEGSLRVRLLDMGLTPHTVISVQKKAPLGDPIEIAIRGYHLTIRLEDASRIEVEELPC